MNQQIRKYVLQNAIRYSGKAQPGAIIGKLLAEDPSLKDRMKDVAKEINLIVKEVNKLSLDQQTAELLHLAPELLEEKKAEKKRELAPLKNAEQGKVVTRLAPEPSKYNHIGHGLIFLINYTYAKNYNGKCILRFEDTNPEKSTQEFVDSMREDLSWVGIKWDKEVIASNDMKAFFEFAARLITQNNAYVCFCKQEVMRDLRFKGVPCACRDQAVQKNVDEWKKMLAKQYKEGECSLRLKGDMNSKNGVMRDPVIFRICYAPHFLQGTEYGVWPTYDFENAVEEPLCGVTHYVRGAEFDLHEELQDYIRELLGLPQPTAQQVGRFNIIGAETQGRVIREMIQQGKVTGWDDPRLVTIKALRRRGILPETLHELVYDLGLNKTQANIDFSMIAAINRRLLDPVARRYFFVQEPVKLTITGAPTQTVNLDKHPEHPEMGQREFHTGSEFFIPKQDAEELKQRKLYRLMGCLNFRKTAKGFEYASKTHDEFKEAGEKIMHWLPAHNNVDVEVLMPDASIAKGVGESGMKELKVDDRVQLERFGFCRVDKVEGNKVWFWYTHK